MTDWEKFKVAELKEECKNRDISITGLKLKQQYIDKLVEYESSTSQDATQAEVSVAEKTNGAIDEVAKDAGVAVSDGQSVPQAESDDNGDVEKEKHVADEIPLAVETDEYLPADRPDALKVEDSQGLEAEAEAEARGADTPIAETVQEAEGIKKNDMLIPQPKQISPEKDAPVVAESTGDTQDAEDDLKEALRGSKPTEIVNDIRERRSQSTSSASDSRKRKRSNASAHVENEAISKKAKLENGQSIPAEERLPSSASTPRRTPSQEEKKGISQTEQNTSDLATMSANRDSKPHTVPVSEPEQIQKRDQEQQSPDFDPQDRSRSPSEDKDNTVPPALHAATRALYMRNFKRPLNHHTLKSHLATVAQGSSSVAPNSNSITFFNINNIRSHAFVIFASISAASRVRTAMHGTRFPNEPQRDALWVDFVPEDQVEDWVEQEMDGSRASGRNSGNRFQVIYNNSPEGGYDAVFEEVDARGAPYPGHHHQQLQHRPSLSHTGAKRPSLSTSYQQRQASYSADPTRTGAIASGVHPDRASLVPQSPRFPSTKRRRSSSTSPHSPVARKKQSVSHSQQDESRSHGFKGLDELFQYTDAKPKLYFKLPPQPVIDDRLDMIGDLYSDRGVSGDPGMKRYTFAKVHGREEWVDDGPEFGHGKRGQDRLVGIGGGRGRGRGGFRGGGRGRGRGDYYGGGGGRR